MTSWFWKLGVVGSIAALTHVAAADTLQLNTGVIVHGTAKDRGDGVVELKVGNRTVLYRATDIKSIEKNDKTGVRTWDEVEANVAKKLASMEELTGLTLEQRNRVDRLIADLATSTPSQVQKIRDTFIQLHADWGLVKYFMYTFSYSKPPWLLDAMVWISPGDAVPILQEAAENPFYETRARAIELLGRLGNRQSESLIARGLVDEKFDVKLAAIYALGNLGTRAATPALVEMLAQPDIKLANAARASLSNIWKTELGETELKSVSEWNDFWEPRKVDGAVTLANLEPLILPEEEMVMG